MIVRMEKFESNLVLYDKADSKEDASPATAERMRIMPTVSFASREVNIHRSSSMAPPSGTVQDLAGNIYCHCSRYQVHLNFVNF